MREKYVEERFSRYFVFGVNLSNSNVDVASTHNDTICSVTTDQAEYLIKDRDDTLDMLVKLALALDKENPELFNRIWYE